MIVNFTCPHCGDLLEADSRQDGETAPCPACNGLVTLHVTRPGEVANQINKGVILGTAAVILASWLGIDN
jgi:Zn-finger nucleic acid-binding protein